VTVAIEAAELDRSLPRSPRQDFWRRFRSDPLALGAAIFLVVLVAAAIGGAPLVAHVTGHGPNTEYQNALDENGLPLGVMQRTYNAAGTQHDPHGELFVLGADRLGRDQLVRVFYGARVSLIVAFGATSIAILIGVLVGLAAGFYGGKIDAVASRLIESAMAFPALLLAVGLAIVIGAGLLNVLIVIAVFTWYYPARIVRTQTISLRRSQFIEAARSIGGSDMHILVRHVLPHLAAPLLVYGTSIVATNILFEAGLSYLGVGVPLPTASWGSMLSDGVTSGYYRFDPALALVPGGALVLTMLALNLLGDGLRDAFDPRSRLR
jgi:ABC-type dipeptide/oligopeptide/nickel transport system permease subunit